MKRLHLFLILSLLIPLASCELDNYDAPDATLYGSFIDVDTNELS